LEKHGLIGSRGGSVSYSRNILSSIIMLAAEEVEGVACDKSSGVVKKSGVRYRPDVKLDFYREGIFVDISVRVRHNYKVPDVAFKIQQSVKRAVETMTEYKVLKVNIFIHDVEFAEDKPAASEGDAHG